METITHERFCHNLVKHLSSAGYRFIVPDAGLTPKQQEGFWRSRINPGLVGAILYGPLFAGAPESRNDAELAKELKGLEEHCSFAACKIDMGYVCISMLIEADGKSDSELIGRCSLIHAKLLEFRKFSTPIARTWGFLEKMSPGLFDNRAVWGQAYCVFNNSRAATEFSTKTSELCKKRTGEVVILPITVDVPAHRLEKWKGMPFGGDVDQISTDKLRARLFEC